MEWFKTKDRPANQVGIRRWVTEGERIVPREEFERLSPGRVVIDEKVERALNGMGRLEPFRFRSGRFNGADGGHQF